MRVNTFLDRDLVKRTKIRAIELNKPMNAVIEDALREYLDRHKHEQSA
jgi:hypothetical protein